MAPCPRSWHSIVWCGGEAREQLHTALHIPGGCHRHVRVRAEMRPTKKIETACAQVSTCAGTKEKKKKKKMEREMSRRLLHLFEPSTLLLVIPFSRFPSAELAALEMAEQGRREWREWELENKNMSLTLKITSFLSPFALPFFSLFVSPSCSSNFPFFSLFFWFNFRSLFYSLLSCSLTLLLFLSILFITWTFCPPFFLP